MISLQSVMRQLPVSQLWSFYRGTAVMGLLLFTSLALLSIRSDIHHQRESFSRDNEALLLFLQQVKSSNAAKLQDFAALIDVMDRENNALVEAFARRIMKDAAKVYLLRAPKQPQRGLMRAVIENHQQAMGSNIDTLAWLRNALNTAESHQSIVASSPFELSEGGLGLVMVLAVPQKPDIEAVDIAFAILVIRASDLLPASLPNDSGYTFALYQSDYRYDDKLGHLIYVQRPSLLAWEQPFLPTLVFEEPVDFYGQTWVFRSEKHLSWLSINWLFLALLWLFTLALVMAFIVARRSHFKQEVDKLVEHDELHQLINYDALTGLPKHGYVEDMFNHAAASSRRRQTSMAFISIELEGLKQVNERYGHEVGDQQLAHAAAALKMCLREGDLIARVGGAEFIVLLQDVRHRFDYARVMTAMTNAIACLDSGVERAVQLRLIMGVAMFPAEGSDVALLQELAKQQRHKLKRKEQSNSNGPRLRLVK